MLTIRKENFRDDEINVILDGFSIYNMLKEYKNQNILSLTLLKNANHNYFNCYIFSLFYYTYSYINLLC